MCMFQTYFEKNESAKITYSVSFSHSLNLLWSFYLNNVLQITKGLNFWSSLQIYIVYKVSINNEQ